MKSASSYSAAQAAAGNKLMGFVPQPILQVVYLVGWVEQSETHHHPRYPFYFMLYSYTITTGDY